MSSTAACPTEELQATTFADRLVQIINSGALSLMLGIGHRTRLFDVMSELPPSTAEEIANTASLNERYVREWLGSMVTGGIIHYDPSLDTYNLPTEHADLLTRSAKPINFASSMQWIAVLGSVENQIVECFENGDGVGYEAFHRFHEVMAEESAQTW